MLKTKCKGCCWQKLDESKLYDKQPFCTLGHETIFDEFLQLEGFCKYKRQSDNDLTVIEEEESQLSVVLVVDEEVSLDTLIAYKALGCQNIVINIHPNINNQQYKKVLVEQLAALEVNKWLIVEQGLSTELDLFHSLEQIPSNWMMIVNKNNMLNLDLFNKFKNNDQVNLVAILDEKNNQFITSKFAYYQLLAGQECGFFEVLKKFDNWSNVCLTV